METLVAKMRRTFLQSSEKEEEKTQEGDKRRNILLLLSLTVSLFVD